MSYQNENGRCKYGADENQCHADFGAEEGPLSGAQLSPRERAGGRDDSGPAAGQDPRQVYKTLVAYGHSKNYYVFVIPVESTLDLKKAAKAAGEKSVEMVPVSELLGLTGYVRGGCSPIGMKKPFSTFFDSEVEKWETVMVSAGKIGWQVELAPAALMELTRGKTALLTAGT